MLRNKFFVHPLELFFNPFDLLACGSTLLVIQLHRPSAGEPPMCAVYNRGDHLQIADQFGGGSRRDFLLPLRFEKQRGVVQNAFTDRGRSPAPGRIQLASFATIAMMLGKNRCHSLAIFQALAGHRHQKLHGHLRRDLAVAHLLLNGFRQQFHQRQPP